MSSASALLLVGDFVFSTFGNSRTAIDSIGAKMNGRTKGLFYVNRKNKLVPIENILQLIFCFFLGRYREVDITSYGA